MRLNTLFTTALIVASGLAKPGRKIHVDLQRRQSGFDFTGVNEAGAEFTPSILPGRLGRDYIWPDFTSIDTMVQTGFNTIRVPILMERWAPYSLGGSVNETYASGLYDTIKYITHLGAYAVFDAHNYGRYYGNIITNPSEFYDFWFEVARRYAGNPLVIFDTNNEYNKMDDHLVYLLNQAAIDAIRAAGATSQYIFVEGNSWTGAWTWVSSGTANHMVALTDPYNNIIYEMHQYLDVDGSGTNDQCVSITIGSERIKEATIWLRANNKIGIIGEMAGGDNPQCRDAIYDMLSFMQQNQDVWKGWLWWAAGPWWNNYMFSMEPPNGVAYTGILPVLTPFI